MADTKFTILGMTGAGKTCFLLGMYYKMCAGMRGYTITTKDTDDDVNLRMSYKKLCDESLGANRFPVGTDNISEYEFNLECAFDPIMSFSWMDYPGNMLDLKSTANDYEQVEKSIMESSCLFICVDGSLLKGNDIDEKIDSIKEECSAVINPFFSQYKREHRGKLPPTAILITKYDECMNDTDRDEICEIVEESFSPFFSSDSNTQTIVAIIPVSIGANINSSDYSGKLKPINIHLPIFMGIYFALSKRINEYKNELDVKSQKRRKINSDIESLKYKKEREEDSFFLWRDGDWIRSLARQIDEKEQELSSDAKEAAAFKNFIQTKSKYIGKLLVELDKIPYIYLNGEKRESFSSITMGD